MVFFATSEPKILSKIALLFESISKSPFEGVGKPEPLKHNLKGHWSRRITDKHRIVYIFANEVVTIVQCRFHY